MHHPLAFCRTVAIIATGMSEKFKVNPVSKSRQCVISSSHQHSLVFTAFALCRTDADIATVMGEKFKVKSVSKSMQGVIS